MGVDGERRKQINKTVWDKDSLVDSAVKRACGSVTVGRVSFRQGWQGSPLGWWGGWPVNPKIHRTRTGDLSGSEGLQRGRHHEGRWGAVVGRDLEPRSL